MAGLDRAAACALGRRYGQLAVFELTADEVRVVRCADGSSCRTRRTRRHTKTAHRGRTVASTTVEAVDVDRQIELLTAGAVDVISEAELRTKIERGAPLRVKLGIDPTASDIHLGFAVVLRRLRLFQDSVTRPCSSSATSPRWSATRRGSRRPDPRLTQGRSRRPRRELRRADRRASSTRRPSASRSCATPSGSRRSTWRTCCG